MTLSSGITYKCVKCKKDMTKEVEAAKMKGINTSIRFTVLDFGNLKKKDKERIIVKCPDGHANSFLLD